MGTLPCCQKIEQKFEISIVEVDVVQVAQQLVVGGDDAGLLSLTTELTTITKKKKHFSRNILVKWNYWKKF